MVAKIYRYVYNLTGYDLISVAAKSHYGVTFDNFLNIYVLLFLHRIVNKRIPSYLCDRLRFVRSPRSRNIVVPRRRYLFSEWQFYLHAIRLWNIFNIFIDFFFNLYYYICKFVTFSLFFSFFYCVLFSLLFLSTYSLLVVIKSVFHLLN